MSGHILRPAPSRRTFFPAASPSRLPARPDAPPRGTLVAMPARTGREYLQGLRDQEREVWLGGERVKDVTTHPGLRRGAEAIASLYDRQHERELRSEEHTSELQSRGLISYAVFC